jgi:hypothetical protein
LREPIRGRSIAKVAAEPNEHVGKVDEAAQQSIRSCGRERSFWVPNRKSFGRSLVYNQNDDQWHAVKGVQRRNAEASGARVTP